MGWISWVQKKRVASPRREEQEGPVRGSSCKFGNRIAKSCRLVLPPSSSLPRPFYSPSLSASPCLPLSPSVARVSSRLRVCVCALWATRCTAAAEMSMRCVCVETSGYVPPAATPPHPPPPSLGIVLVRADASRVSSLHEIPSSEMQSDWQRHDTRRCPSPVVEDCP